MGKTTTKHLIISLGTLLLGVAILGAMSFMIHKKEQTLKSQWIAVHKQAEQEEAFRKLQKVADDSKKDRESLSKYFIYKESDSIEVLTLIEGLAPKSGIYLETKGLQKISDKDTKTDWVEINFDFSGRRENVEDFIGILERLPYFAYITSLSLTERSLENWQAVVTLRVYIANHDNK
jgi:predicted RNA binding protein with dsRBD fold (UPF0201 family)